MSDEYEDDFDEYDEDFEEDTSDSNDDVINDNMENNNNEETDYNNSNNNTGGDIMMDGYGHESDSPRNPKLTDLSPWRGQFAYLVIFCKLIWVRASEKVNSG